MRTTAMCYRAYDVLRLTLTRMLAVLTFSGIFINSYEFACAAEQASPATVGNPIDGLDEIVVSAKKVQFDALGNQAVLNTPFSVDIVDSVSIQDLQYHSLSDLVSSIAAATVNAPEATEASSISLRGFTAGQTFVDGFQVPSEEPPVELYDNIQVLQGAAGLFYGFAPAGGVVNYITKRPTDKEFVEGNLGYRSDSTFSEHVDASTAASSSPWAARLNLFYEDGILSTYKTGVKRMAVALDVDLHFSATTTVRIDTQLVNRDLDRVFYEFVPIYGDAGTFQDVSANKQYTPTDSKFLGRSRWVNATLIQKLAEEWELKLSATYAEYRSNYRSILAYADTIAGDLSYVGFAQNQLNRTATQHVLVTGQADWIGLDHKIAFGGDVTLQKDYLGSLDDGGTFDYVAISNTSLTNFVLPTATGIINPSLSSKVPSDRINQYSGFATDTVTFEKLSILAGVRYLKLEDENYLQVSSQSPSKLAPAGALIYKPNPGSTIYASFAESLEAGSVVSNGYTNSGQTLSPIVTKQYEIGVKSQIGDIYVSGAIFRIEQVGYDYVNQSVPQTVYQNGIERHDGIELSVDGKFSNSLRLVAGAQFLRPRILDVPADQSASEPDAVPRVQLKLNARYNSPVTGLTLIGGAQYVGSFYIDPLNRNPSDAYTTFNIGANYSLSPDPLSLTLRAAVDNLLDKQYYVPCNCLRPGDPRTFKLALSKKF